MWKKRKKGFTSHRNYTKETKIDQIEIVGDFKAIQVRTVEIIKENGEEIQRGGYHRHVIMPGDDISNESAEIKAIAASVHTDDLKAAYTAHLAAKEQQFKSETQQQWQNLIGK